MNDPSPSTRVLRGVLVDPVLGVRAGRLRLDGDVIGAVDQLDEEVEEPFLFPGFVDLQIYDLQPARAQGVTGYLATVGTSAPGTVDEFLASLPGDPACLGAHVEGPFLNPDAAGAQAHEHIRPVDLDELDGWLATGAVRLLTLAPELHGAFEAIERVVRAGGVAALGHTASNHRTAMLAVEAGARFATHVWNAMSGLRARAPGAIGAFLEDERVMLGLIADGRHLHPATEAITIRLAGPRRIALTSDLVAPPQHRADGRLLGGDRCGAALVRRLVPRYGLAETATMASLVPAETLGLPDRGRLVPGFRADLAVLGRDFEPLETIVGGETVWTAAQRVATVEGKPSPAAG